MPRSSSTSKIGGSKLLRLGSTKVQDTWGQNMQNIEKSLRRIYIPDEGKCFIQVDQAGAEAKIVAMLCKPGNKLKALFDNKIKPHTYLGLMFPEQWQERFPFAAELRHYKLDELTKSQQWKELSAAIALSDNNPPATRFYYHYKQTVHSSNYGVKEGAFRMNVLEKSGGKVVLTNEQAKTYLGGYHEMVPEVREWWAEVEELLYKTHTLYNLKGFPLYFNTINQSMLKEAYACIPQSTVACITHEAYTNFQSYVESNNREWDILVNGHDSYLIQCPIEEVELCAGHAKSFMEQELVSPRGEKFRMGSEVGVGFNWAPRSSYNLTGLTDLKTFLEGINGTRTNN